MVDEEDGGAVGGQAPAAGGRGPGGRRRRGRRRARRGAAPSGRPATARSRATSRRSAFDSCDGRRSTAAPRPPGRRPVGAATGRLGRHQQVLGHGEVLEQLQGLERAGQAEAGPPVGRRGARPARPSSEMRPAAAGTRPEMASRAVVLPAPLGPMRPVTVPAPQVEVDVGHRLHRPEPHGQAPHLEDAAHRVGPSSSASGAG